MAKTVTYQIAAEILREVAMQVPLLDAEGNPVVKEIVTPVTEEVTVPVYDDAGEPLLDENGEAVTQTRTVPVYHENGEPVVEITYEQIFTEELRQETETVLTDVELICGTQASLDANLPVVQREAYNGAYTVTGEFDPEPETAEEVLNTLLGVTE